MAQGRVAQEEKWFGSRIVIILHEMRELGGITGSLAGK